MHTISMHKHILFLNTFILEQRWCNCEHDGERSHRYGARVDLAAVNLPACNGYMCTETLTKYVQVKRDGEMDMMKGHKEK